MLTDKQIIKAAPGLHAAGGGLYIRVSPKGKKTWVVRDRSNGGDKWKSIGTYPSTSLAQARNRGDNLEVSRSDAISLFITKVDVARPDLVEELMKEFPYSIQSSRQQLVTILQDKAKTAPVMANRMLSRWKDFLNFCVQQGWLQENVLEPVQRRFIGGKEKGRTRVLDWNEIAAIGDVEFRLMLATGLRSTEALWVLNRRQTTDIPNKRTPTDGYLHTLPKSKLVATLLKRKIAVPSSHLTLSNRLRRRKATFTPHDLRRTFATRLSDMGVAPHVVEKLLGHKMQGVMAVYNHAEYWPERHAAQKLWDAKLISLWRSNAAPCLPSSPPSAGT